MLRAIPAIAPSDGPSVHKFIPAPRSSHVSLLASGRGAASLLHLPLDLVFTPWMDMT